MVLLAPKVFTVTGYRLYHVTIAILKSSEDKGFGSITSDLLLTNFYQQTATMGLYTPGKSIAFSALHQHLA